MHPYSLFHKLLLVVFFAEGPLGMEVRETGSCGYIIFSLLTKYLPMSQKQKNKITLPGLFCLNSCKLNHSAYGVWHETGMFRKRFLFSQMCIQLDRFVKLHDDKGTTDKKKAFVCSNAIWKKFLSLSTSRIWYTFVLTSSFLSKRHQRPGVRVH